MADVETSTSHLQWPVTIGRVNGNQFAVADAREVDGPVTDEAKSLGPKLAGNPLFDDVLVLESSNAADVYFHVAGADGRLANWCGNGALLVASLIGSEKNKQVVRIAGAEGTRQAVKQGDWWRAEIGAVRSLTPSVEGSLADYSLDVDNVIGIIQSGEPHLVVRAPAVLSELTTSQSEIEAFCGPLRNAFDIAGGINVTLVFEQSDRTLSIKTYERGANRLTLSCGTGSVAAVAAVTSSEQRSATKTWRVISPGGIHKVERAGGDWHLSGMPVKIAEGQLEDDELRLPVSDLEGR